MEQVSIIKMENRQILDQFDCLAAQMEAFMKSNTFSTWCHARGHTSESGNQAWCSSTAASRVRPTHPGVALFQWNHPFMAILYSLWMKVTAAQVARTHGVIYWVKNLCQWFESFFKILMASPNQMMERLNYMLKQFTLQHKINLVSLVETNMGWDLLTCKQRLPQKTQGWWEIAHSTLGFNCMDTCREIYQMGGMAILAINAIAHWQVHSSGDDMTGMGQWCWICLQGCGNYLTR